MVCSMSALKSRPLVVSGAGALSLALSAVALATAASVHVHVQHKISTHQNIHLTFKARSLPEGGYYYGVVVLKPYRKYTKSSPPPCSTSSDMQHTNYGYPRSNHQVALTLTPAKSSTGHWCPGGSYQGAIYAVPHAPPCESSYPCQSEPYKEPCAGVAPGCVTGIVAPRRKYAYPDGLPQPRATGTTVVARFSVKFPH